MPVPALLRCLRSGSPELRRLALQLRRACVPWLSISSSGDLLVPAACTAVPALTEAVVVEGVGHCGLLRDQEVVARVVAAVTARCAHRSAAPAA